jgi:N-acetylmuramoyl-L-alanine amidase
VAAFKGVVDPLLMKKTIIFIFISLLASGCATAPSRHVSDNSLKDLCDRHGITWFWDSVSETVSLKRGEVTAKALVGSEVVIVRTDKVYLSEPIRRERGRIIVPPDFKAKVIDRLTEAREVYHSAPLRVVIDAGHGGKDPGAIGVSGSYEKNVTLDIAKKVKQILEQNGIKAVLTRASDQALTLEKRTEIASQEQGDLFVSIHANSNPTRSVSGIEVYDLRPLTWAEKKEPQRRRNQQLLFSRLAMKQNDEPLEKILSDMLFNYKTKESPSLAASVTSSLTNGSRAHNRGVKKAGYNVLRNSLVPAVLVEVGFLSNPKEERQLNTSAYQGKIADGIAEGILHYINRSR